MTMPWRQFNFFDFSGHYGYDATPVGVPFDQQANWNADRLTEIICGEGKLLAPAGAMERRAGIFRPQDTSYKSQTSLNHPALIKFGMTISGPSVNTAGVGTFKFWHGTFDSPAPPAEWDKKTATGQTYDGINSWADFPLVDNLALALFATAFSPTVAVVDLPKEYSVYAPAYSTGGATLGLPRLRDYWYANGWWWKTSNYDIGDVSGWANGEEFYFNFDLNDCIVRYFNPVVNSFSAYWMKPAGGDAIVITGLGFENSDAEIEEGGNANPGPWNDDVNKIFFEGLQGQGTTTLNSPADFTIDSNTQITIPAMPPLAAGTYHVRLEKNGHAVSAVEGDPDAYAGDWHADAAGQVRPSIRMVFLVIADFDDGGPGRTPIILTRWAWKSKALTVFDHYAPIDTVSPAAFYDGRILSVSGLRRSLDDRFGLFQGSEVTIDLANHDKYFSKMLATYFIKNQVVEIFVAFKNSPEGWKSYSHRLIVEDHSRPGPIFSVRLRDITTKYFGIQVPLYIATEDEYPNIDDSARGRGMPEVLGLNEATGENAGAIEALYIDTVNYEYLAARGSLYDITNVYEDGVAVDGAEYSVLYRDGGRTYIRFTSDREGKRITYNAKGYVYGPWNSANGYIQSPAYVAAFLVGFLAEVPVDFLNTASFDDVHAIMEARGLEEAGHLAIQDRQDLTAVLQEVLFTFGIKSFPDSRGMFKLGIKDIADFETDIFIRTQIDTLEFPAYLDNTTDAFNYARARYAFAPAPGLFAKEQVDIYQPSVDDYEAAIEPSYALDWKWTTSDTLVASRLVEELHRYGYGNKKITFPVSFDWFDKLDIFLNFRLENPWGISADGSGETGRYYYIEALDYDFIGNRIMVTAIDLQWLLRQYFILGDEGDHEALWDNAVESSRMYGYLANELTGLFSDGEPGKILIDEGKLE